MFGRRGSFFLLFLILLGFQWVDGVIETFFFGLVKRGDLGFTGELLVQGYFQDRIQVGLFLVFVSVVCFLVSGLFIRQRIGLSSILEGWGVLVGGGRGIFFLISLRFFFLVLGWVFWVSRGVSFFGYRLQYWELGF